MMKSLFSKKACNAAAAVLLLFTTGCTITKDQKAKPAVTKKTQNRNDFEKLRYNCAAFVQKKYFDQKKTEQFLASQKNDGSWPDIDYTCQNWAGWRTAAHLTRLRIMAAGWSNPESSLYHSEKLGSGIKRGLEYWTKEKRRSPNWWWNEIHVPMTLGHTFILCHDLLKDGPWLNAAIPYLNQAKLGYTGQNRIWVAKGVLFKGILTADEKLIKAAHQSMLSEIAYAKGNEGIRVDASFHQHGPQLQFGNYGLSYLSSITVLIYYFSDTRWALTKIDPFRDFVINGIKWVLWKDVMDLTAQGRQIWKDTQTAKNKVIRNSIAMLVEKDPAFAEQYKKEPVGNRMFFRSDYMVHRTEDFYASFKANSLHTLPVETYVIGDNRLGRYFSDGVLMVMRSGKEYLNIAGCWEWNRLPGTTLPALPLVQPDDQTKIISRPARVKGESTFTGGVSDGKKYGAMIYTMNVDKVKAKKAVFFADKIIIALGSGIDSTSPYPVATTVEQSLLNGKVEKGDGYFYHNNIGYSGKNITLSTGKRKGNWKLLWGGYKTSMPDEKAIFQLTIDHGKNVRNGSYEYAIYPDTPRKDIPAVMKSYKVLANNNTVQAVKLKDNTIMAVFHKNGKLDDFSTDSAGIFILRAKKIFAADPSQKKTGFTLTLNGKTYKVKLPGGKFAGKTVMIDR